jgi:cell division protein FtsB
MALKFMLENLDDLDESLKGLYSKHTDGKYYLDVDGAVSKSKIDEFRDNNISLKQQIEELTDKYGNIDIEKYQELMDKAALDDGKKRITMDKVDELVADRTRTMKEEHQNQLSQLTTTNTELSSQLNGLLIDGAIRSAAVEAKVRTGALEDVVLRAKQTFKVVDGKAVAHDDKDNIIYGKDGTSPLSTKEWISSLKTSADHLFEQSKGGGAGGGSDNRGVSDKPAGDTAQLSPLQKISAGMESKS